MSRKPTILSCILDSDYCFQVDLLKLFFAEKRFPVIIRIETLTFQTEVAAVLVNNAKFVQAKGKTREEAQKSAVRKAWEKAVARGKEGDFAGVMKRLAETKGNSSIAGGVVVSASPTVLNPAGISPRRGRDIASAPMSPADCRDSISRTIVSVRTSDHLDSLISAAAKAVEHSSPQSHRRLSLKATVRKSLPSESALRSLFHPRTRTLESQNHSEETTGEKSLEQVMELEENQRKVKRVQYRSLADARFEMKMKRVSLSIVSRDGEDTEK